MRQLDFAAAQRAPSQPLFSQAPSIGLKFLSDYGLRQNWQVPNLTMVTSWTVPKFPFSQLREKRLCENCFRKHAKTTKNLVTCRFFPMDLQKRQK
jgi:hypothetical protein